MIARTWRGATRAADATSYAAYIEATGLRAFAATPGNLGALVLQRPLESEDTETTEVVVISFWDSMEAVSRFAGREATRAVFYPEDDRYLVRRDLTVDHYEVVAQLGAPVTATA
jgi:heme-degrading monooxygenase HmoA